MFGLGNWSSLKADRMGAIRNGWAASRVLFRGVYWGTVFWVAQSIGQRMSILSDHCGRLHVLVFSIALKCHEPARDECP